MAPLAFAVAVHRLVEGVTIPACRVHIEDGTWLLLLECVGLVPDVGLRFFHCQGKYKATGVGGEVLEGQVKDDDHLDERMGLCRPFIPAC